MLLIPSLLVTAVGLWLVVFILKSVLPKRLFDFSAYGRRREVSQHGERLDKVERLIKGGFQREVANEFLEIVPFFKSKVIEQANAAEILNGRALALLLAASEKFNVSLDVLPVIEGLLQVRQEAVQNYIDVEGKFQEKKRTGALPGWGAEEFRKKLKEISARLDVNERAIRDQLKLVRDSFVSIKSSGDVVH